MAAKTRVRRLPTRTKIVATIGPASDSVTTVRALIRAGTNVFRLNFSHGTVVQHGRAIRAIRRAQKQEGVAVAILADLQGPKIRVGNLEDNEPLLLKRGERLTIVADPDLVGTAGRIGCTYVDLPRDVRSNDRILLDDGSLELRVESTRGDEVHTRVRYGGLLLPHKGINLPGTKVRAPSLGEKDLVDLEFAISQEVDYVALSFVRTAADMKHLKTILDEHDSDAEAIAKIERPEAVKNLEAIVAAADGIMIARGDMGVEVGAAFVPGIQKRIIKMCIEEAKPVITATQMLESMMQSPRPTRAEASDVANAIWDGSSALMLSGETAAGKYPVLAVKTMDRIARQVGSEIFGTALRHPSQRIGDLRRVRRRSALPIGEATVSAAARAALELDAKVLAVFTETGRTAKLLARERLQTRLLAFTPSVRTYQKLALHWGIIPVLTKRSRTIEAMHVEAERLIQTLGHGRAGECGVFVAGSVQVAGATNTVTIREIQPASVDS